MTKEELLTYKDDEKAVEIQEFQIGATDDICPCQLVYKVTIYSNIKQGFFKNVKYDKYTFPFYKLKVIKSVNSITNIISL